MIAIVDYGMGNLKSVTNAFGFLKAGITITREPDVIRNASAVVLPGVGAFGKCIENLETYGLTGVLREVIASGKRYLGICLGLQILFEASEEAPGARGLGIIKGRVVRFSDDLKVPHMGWNSVNTTKPSPIFEGIPSGSHFYFVHSYYPEPAEEVAATVTDYGIPFVSAIEKNNVFACQFHPEKSQRVGLQLLRNFIRLCDS